MHAPPTPSRPAPSRPLPRPSRRRSLPALAGLLASLPLLAIAPGLHAAPTAAPAPDAAPPPVYRTRLPDPVVLSYEITRGPWRGEGELAWEPQDRRYRLRLEGRVMGVRVITQDSRGLVDTAGIAPLTFSDERRGKAPRVATFQRNTGQVTYSANADVVRLRPGMQDRLSWMLQVGAVAAADPARVAAGERVAMFVTGARGDADLWTFRSNGVEPLVIRGVRVEAVKLAREPRKPDDSAVEIWLDTRQHLPVRARMTNDGETFELLRRFGDPS